MGKLTVIIPDGLEKRFRIEIIRRYNGKRGDLTKAITDAITYLLNLWTEPTSFPKDEIRKKIEKMPHGQRVKLKKDLRSLFYGYIEPGHLNHTDVIELIAQSLNVQKTGGTSAFNDFVDHNISGKE